MKTIAGGRFVVDEKPFATGGFGRVFKAIDHEASDATSSQVAIKLLNREAISEPSFVQRFHREIAINRSLSHANLLPMIASGVESDGLLWYAMPFAEGGDLGSYVRRNGKLSPPEVLNLTRQAGLGLEYLHASGVTHRDLSPGNILRYRDAWVISDFGLSVSTVPVTSYMTTMGANQLGTPAFAAPEQVDQLAASNALSDQFSLGKIVQYALEARWPTHPPQLTTAARSAVEKATAYDPDRRYKDVRAFIDVIESEFGAPPELILPTKEQWKERLRSSSSLSPDEGLQFLNWGLHLDVNQESSQRQLLEVVVYLDAAAIRSLQQADQRVFWRVFDNAVAASSALRLNFDDVDPIANFYDRVARTSTDLAKVSSALEALARLGSSYDRWDTRRLIHAHMRAATSAEQARVVYVGLSAAHVWEWILADGDNDDYPPEMRRWIEGRPFLG